MKKILSLILCLVIIFSFAACGDSGSSKTAVKSAPSGEYFSDALGEIKFVFKGDTVTTSNSMWDDGKEASLTYKIGEDGTLYFDGQSEYDKSMATEWNYRKMKFDKSADVISSDDSVFILINTSDKNYSLGKNALKGIYYSDAFIEVMLDFSGNEVTAYNSMWDENEGKAFLYRIGDDGKLYFVAKDESQKYDALDWTYLNLRYDKSADVIVDEGSIYVLNKVNEKDITKN